VLLTLAGFALWAAVFTSNAAGVATDASLVSAHFSDARYAVGQEESLERQYTLAPSPSVRAQHAAAARDMTRALEGARDSADPIEREAANLALRLQNQYLAAIQRQFRAVDRYDDAGALRIDATQTHPLFMTIEHSVDLAAERAASKSANALRGLRGTERLVLIATPIVFAIGLLVLAFFTLILIAALRRSRNQADENRHMALHDGLTGLPNRMLYNDRLGQALRDATRQDLPVSVLMIDLDRFKEVNDTLGHAVGDELLSEAGSRLRAVMRERDTIARMGGDEFAVLLPGTDPAGARRVVGSIDRAFVEPFALMGMSVDAKASIGIACFPEHGNDAETLLQRADVAMYFAKGRHVGHALYSPEQDPYDPDLLALVGELRRAISDDELVLHYQPKLDLATDSVLGVEALVRWRHPSRGLLAPAAFVPLAEHTGMIRPLTLWVLERALAQARTRMLAGRELTIAVNLAAQNLLDPEFASDVVGLLGKHGIPAHLLEFEITEGSVMDDPERSIVLLQELRDLGIKLSIDDFGTGYSSLSYLTQLPVHEIKIDKGFVMAMDTSADDAVIVRSTIDLARNLGFTVVAEGVETEESLRILRALGCDSAQGYLLSRPVPVEELDIWLKIEPGLAHGSRVPMVLSPAAATRAEPASPPG